MIMSIYNQKEPVSGIYKIDKTRLANDWCLVLLPIKRHVFSQLLQYERTKHKILKMFNRMIWVQIIAETCNFYQPTASRDLN